ncbi:MAG: DUF4982 domain-containing protein [Prevotellaceae bacterium]|nr:DUF4982 domain-containing protein [Prevotellaceae bacterium]
MNTRHFLLVPTLLASLAAWGQHDISFDNDWTYTLSDGTTHHVTLPRAWNEDSAFRVLIDSLPTDTVRYVKTFTLPSSAKGKHVFIEFEGARQMAKVWLNGHLLGMHENGVSAFGFDLTPHLRFDGSNRLEVLTDNRWDYREAATNSTFQWSNRNFNANYGGLPKHVRLHILNDVHQTLPLYSSFGTTGVYVYATDIDVAQQRATIVTESQVRNSGSKSRNVRLDVSIEDRDGKCIARFQSPRQRIEAGQTLTLRASAAVGNLHFWTWGDGYLYNIRARVADDEVCVRTGFRKTAFAHGQISLNDRVLMVHGYAQRTSNEWPGVGMSIPAWLSDYSNGMMVRSGGNLVRWMHVAPWRQDVESCDRVGLLQAMPAGDAEKDVEGRQWEQRVELMRDAIVYYRNNPSIIFYESGNKGISEEHMAQMRAIRDEFDPHGGRAIGSREMLGANTCAEYGGEMLYINKSGGKPVWAMEYCRDEGLRRYWDDWSYPYHRNGDGPLYRNEDASAYNLNQDQLAVEHVRRWYDYYDVRPGTGRRVSSGGVKIIFSDTNTHCRGESNYRTSGVVDAMRLPKDSYYTHQVMWDGWVEPDVPHVYIMGHNNYPANTVKPVYVVANTDSVVLLLNGQPLPSPRRDYHFLFTTDSVHIQDGTLEAIGYNDGIAVCRHAVETVGTPVQLRLSALTAPDGLKADGADMALIQFEAVDAQGRRHPLDNRVVNFRIEGPAEWRGGIAKGEGNCILSTALPLECGVNRALIRTTTESGTIRIVAQADGLPEAVIELESGSPTPTAHTAQTLPGDECPQTLIDGWQAIQQQRACAETDGFRHSDNTIAIARVTAGCNEDTAIRSIDDDEETEWRNDGRAATAWITYHLAQPEKVGKISMKLTGWRRRSYPIDIYADDQLVWSGNTPTTLGYVSIPLQSASPASAITIRLRSATTESDGFSQVTELVQATANELDLYRAKDGDKVRHELRIIECDLLKP